MCVNIFSSNIYFSNSFILTMTAGCPNVLMLFVDDLTDVLQGSKQIKCWTGQLRVILTCPRFMPLFIT